MTTPTPAGWYPDPDGSGGQRYWDGDSWTEHRAPAAPTPPPPAEPPAPAEPVEPGLPAQPPANEEPTAVVHLRSVPTETHVGAHRKPDTEDEPSEPEPSQPDSYTQKTEPVSQRLTPAVPPPVDPTPFDIPPTQSGPFPSAPAFGAPTAPPSDANRSLLIRFGAACAALLVVLVGLAIYGFLIKKDPDVQLSTPGDDTATQSPANPSPRSGWGNPATTAAAPSTAAPPPPAPTGNATDGPLSFTVHGTEIGPTVVMADAPMELTATGEFVVVRMTVSNTGPDAESFVGMFQTLLAGGTTYPLADQATAYLGGTAAELQPGEAVDVSLAFDVPPGTVPEAVELHAEPGSPGVQIPLP